MAQRCLTFPLRHFSLSQLLLFAKDASALDSQQSINFMTRQMCARFARIYASTCSVFVNKPNDTVALKSAIDGTCSRLLVFPKTTKQNAWDLLSKELEHIDTEIDRFVNLLKSMSGPAPNSTPSLSTSTSTEHRTLSPFSTDVVNKYLDEVNVHLIELRLQTRHLKSLLSEDTVRDKVIDEDCNIHALVTDTVSHARQFCIEKNSLAPEVEVRGDEKTTAICPPHFIHFILMEVLKNSMRAMIEKHHTNVDISPPLQLTLSADQDDVGIRVSDTGGGVPRGLQHHMFDYFYTTSMPFEPTYTYSRAFGAPFTGLGVGLPRSRLYARYLGGDLSVCSVPGYGADVYITFRRRGDNIKSLL
eukprot:GILK01010507.1.p1 GENE.GILK01010507.1~~GILK01010507.1.p1  ORF type:complete len:367 (+),score=25.92 GILK01010507.1:25-1101(+)